MSLCWRNPFGILSYCCSKSSIHLVACLRPRRVFQLFRCQELYLLLLSNRLRRLFLDYVTSYLIPQSFCQSFVFVSQSRYVIFCYIFMSNIPLLLCTGFQSLTYFVKIFLAAISSLRSILVVLLHPKIYVLIVAIYLTVLHCFSNNCYVSILCVEVPTLSYLCLCRFQYIPPNFSSYRMFSSILFHKAES